MSWDYRVISKNGQLAIHEVFYKENGEIKGFTLEPVTLRGNSLEDLKEESIRYLRALDLPVLEFE